MKFLSTFRAKLILSIFPIVAGVTIGSLLLSEWKFSATYQRLFEEQFEGQISAVTQAKNKRFEALSAVLDRLAQSPVVIGSMKQGDFHLAGVTLRPMLESLAQERLQSEFGTLPVRLDARASHRPPSSPGPDTKIQDPRRDDFNKRRDLFQRPGGPPGGGTSPFIALVDSKGKFVSNSKPRPGPGDVTTVSVDGDLVSRKSQGIPWLGKRNFEEALHEQQVGYLLVEAGERRGEQVREIFVTPLRDPDTKSFLGAFVFGLPLPALADRVLYEQTRRSEFGEIMGGIYVEGKLVSSTVPENVKPLVAAAVEQSMKRSDKERREVLLPIDGVQHRVIYRVLNPGSPFPQAAQVNFYSLAALHSEIKDLRRSAIALGTVALAIALLWVTLASRGLSGPVSKLVVATQEIERGNYDVRVPVTKDEFGQVAHAFNDMAAGLALQEKYRSVLHSVADRTIADRLIENPGALRGELRQVTTLFCDIRGFTALTEKMPPHDVIELLNEHMTALTEVAYAHGGTVDKFVGDLIMVLFGAPEDTEEDTVRAVKCAQAMQVRRRELNASAKHPLETGIGLATGMVVAGCMGSDKRLNYTVLGHHVNLASRLCSIAQPGEIIADPATVEVLNGSITSHALPLMQLKGFSESVQPYRIT
ncbi:MAG: adenylate/guanylate cyclase domain-containing protein [Verrucomicrobiota bacterium]